MQEAAYASLPFKLRRELHAAVGLRLERDHSRTLDADPALLSHHFAAAGDYVRAHRYAMVAAGRATERFSHADAAELYRRAIETGRAGGMAADAPALAEAWEKLGDALRCTGELQAAARALTEARRLYHDPIAQARLCDSQAEVAERCEALTAAVRWLTRGLRYIEGLQTTGARIARARIRSHLGGIRNRQGRWAEAVRVFRQAIADAEAVGELPALARACYGLDWALVELGTAAEPTHSWRALEIYEQLGDFEHEATVLNYLGMFAYFDGRWDEAIGLYRRAGEASERAGVPADVAYTDCNVGEILSDQGRLDEAAAHLERARRVWLATGELPSVAFVDLLLARVAVRRGGSPAGVAQLRAATDQLRSFGVDAYAEFGQALIAEAEAFTGDPARALKLAREGMEHADQYRPVFERAYGIALARLGRRDAAEEQLAHALQAARERRAYYEIAASIDVLDAIESGRRWTAPRAGRHPRAAQDRSASDSGGRADRRVRSAALRPHPGVAAFGRDLSRSEPCRAGWFLDMRQATSSPSWSWRHGGSTPTKPVQAVGQGDRPGAGSDCLEQEAGAEAEPGRGRDGCS